MSDAIKVLGWTIGGAVAVKLLTSPTFGTAISNITGGWAKILGAITGNTGGTTP